MTAEDRAHIEWLLGLEREGYTLARDDAGTPLYIYAHPKRETPNADD